MARWFRGGELVGGETPWWRGDRIPCILFDSIEFFRLLSVGTKSGTLFQANGAADRGRAVPERHLKMSLLNCPSMS